MLKVDGLKGEMDIGRSRSTELNGQKVLKWTV